LSPDRIVAVHAVDPARCPSGVYLIDGAQRDRIVRGDAFPPRLHLAVLDRKIASSREALFAEIARTMRFPAYFGHNWDAVYDCLTDLRWLTADGYALVFDGFNILARNEPEQWQILLNLLCDACAFWQPLPRPMYALLHDPGDAMLVAPAFPAACLPGHNEGE
jgi:RNAse (barnase) inhibitor barstar